MTDDATVTCREGETRVVCRVGDFSVYLFDRVDMDGARWCAIEQGPQRMEFCISELANLMAALAGASKAEDALDEG